MTARPLPPPRVLGSFASGVVDFVDNAWRFLLANLLIGVLLVIMSLVVGRAPAGYLLAIPMILPVAGLMRMAIVQVRTGGARFSDFLAPMRHPWTLLGLGSLQLVITFVLWLDVFVGLGSGQLLLAVLSVGAVYLLLAIWSYAVVTWPILLDPLHDGEDIRSRLRLGLQVLLTHPMRVLAFALLSGILLAFATAAIGIVVTFGLSLIWLAVANFTLALTDRYEGRLVEPDDAE